VSIQRRHDPRALIFEPFERGADASALAALDGVDKITRDGGTYRIDLREGADPVRAMRAVAAAVPPSRLEVHRPSLEDIFIGLVT
jgi:ABC-type uncharacterized transport system ATPase subunit